MQAVSNTQLLSSGLQKRQQGSSLPWHRHRLGCCQWDYFSGFAFHLEFLFLSHPFLLFFMQQPYSGLICSLFCILPFIRLSVGSLLSLFPSVLLSPVPGMQKSLVYGV